MNFGLVVRDAQLGDESSTCDDDQVVLGDDPVSWVLVDPLVVLVDPLVIVVVPLVVVVVVVVFPGCGGLSLRYQGSNLPTGT